MKGLTKMRIGIPLSLYSKKKEQTPVLNISYQSRMLSLIKRGVSNQNPELFKKLYSKNQIKDFATSVFFSACPILWKGNYFRP